MNAIKTNELRANMSDVLNRVKYQGESIMIERYDKPLAALVPAKVLTDLDALNVWADAQRRRLKGLAGDPSVNHG